MPTALMLSAETATGKYPVKVVQMMERIARFNEEQQYVPALIGDDASDQSEVISHAVMDILIQEKDFKIDAVVVFTETGRIARSIARFRPKLPVFAITESEQVKGQLALVYGVTAYVMDFPAGEVIDIGQMIEPLTNMKLFHRGHRVVFVHGDRWKIPGFTNTITIKEII